MPTYIHSFLILIISRPITKQDFYVLFPDWLKTLCQASRSTIPPSNLHTYLSYSYNFSTKQVSKWCLQSRCLIVNNQMDTMHIWRLIYVSAPKWVTSSISLYNIYYPYNINIIKRFVIMVSGSLIFGEFEIEFKIWIGVYLPWSLVQERH